MADLDDGYAALAADELLEAEAYEWIEAVAADVAELGGSRHEEG
jgi:hypothetical protein